MCLPLCTEWTPLLYLSSMNLTPHDLSTSYSHLCFFWRRERIHTNKDYSDEENE